MVGNALSDARFPPSCDGSHMLLQPSHLGLQVAPCLLGRSQHRAHQDLAKIHHSLSLQVSPGFWSQGPKMVIPRDWYLHSAPHHIPSLSVRSPILVSLVTHSQRKERITP